MLAMGSSPASMRNADAGVNAVAAAWRSDRASFTGEPCARTAALLGLLGLAGDAASICAGGAACAAPMAEPRVMAPMTSRFDDLEVCKHRGGPAAAWAGAGASGAVVAGSAGVARGVAMSNDCKTCSSRSSSSCCCGSTLPGASKHPEISPSQASMLSASVSSCGGSVWAAAAAGAPHAAVGDRAGAAVGDKATSNCSWPNGASRSLSPTSSQTSTTYDDTSKANCCALMIALSTLACT
mmetsp:Transcript_56196/g.162880  ORF Transcript_56196/g.162880 Transcript_56196/m.162880 type:complete len:239 (+) Transcript_56196:539-1255(+)